MNHVIIGASAAGLNAAAALRKLCPEDAITVVSTDEQVYSRCMLHHVISGHRSIASLAFVNEDFFARNKLHWLKGKTATSLNTAKCLLALDDQSSLSYDRLLIAAGSSSAVPPIPNLNTLARYYTLRDLSDALAIGGQAKTGMTAVILGGGLIGADAAVGLAAKGVKVTIIEMGPHLLPIQLDATAAANYEQLFAQNGITVFSGMAAKEILQDDRRQFIGVALADGRKCPGDMLIVAAGIRPNTAWITDAAISLNRGIVTDDSGRTSVANVYAAGDITGKSAIWPQAVKQGIVAAYNMAGQDHKLEDHFQLKNSMNFYGLQTVALGIAEPPDDSYNVDIYHKNGVYKKLIHRQGIVYGAIFQGDIAFCGFWTKMICSGLLLPLQHNKPLLDVDYSDYFNMAANGTFQY